MTDYLAGKNETQFGKGPDFSRISLFTAWGAGKGWNFVPLAPGILGVFLAYNLYQLLDGRFLLMGVVFLFFLLTGLVPRASVVSGLALAWRPRSC